MRVRELAKLRDDKVRAEFLKLKSQRKYTNEYIFSEILKPKFFISERTLENIVYEQPKKPVATNQLALF